MSKFVVGLSINKPEKFDFAEKLGENVKNWKVRFFVLYTNGTFEYYQNVKEGTIQRSLPDLNTKGDLLGTYVVKDCKFRFDKYKGHDHCIILERVNDKGRDLVISYPSQEIQMEWKKAFAAIGCTFHGETGTVTKSDKGFQSVRSTLPDKIGKNGNKSKGKAFDSKSEAMDGLGIKIAPTPVNGPVNINTLKTLNSQLEKEKKILEKDILTREEETNKLRDNLYKMEKERLESKSKIDELENQLSVLTQQYRRLQNEFETVKSGGGHQESKRKSIKELIQHEPGAPMQPEKQGEIELKDVNVIPLSDSLVDVK